MIPTLFSRVQRRARAFLYLLTLLQGVSAHAQSGSLTVVGSWKLTCPATAAWQTGVGLYNGNASSVTIPPGTTLTFSFSAPVLLPPSPPVPGAAVSATADAVTVVFPAGHVIPADGFLRTWGVVLNLAQAVPGTLITARVTASPPAAITFSQEVNTVVLGYLDSQVCQPPPAGLLTADELNSTCPSATEVVAYRTALDISFESDPSSGTLVCRAADGSADLTRLQERVYQALRFMQRVPLSVPLPWTVKSLYDWFTSSIRGIRHRSGLSNSFCCDPAGVINIQTDNLGILQFGTPEWLMAYVGLLVHEARHSDGLPHTCGPYDQTLSELGAVAVQHYTHEWLSWRSGSFFLSRGPTPGAYKEWIWESGQWMVQGGICDRGPRVAASPGAMMFGDSPPGAQSLPRTVVISSTTTSPMRIHGASIVGTHAQDFQITSDTCEDTVVPPGCVIRVVFKPGGIGARSAALSANFGDSGGTLQVPLTGNGHVTLPCAFLLSANQQSLPAGGGASTILLSTTPGCEWTSASGAHWLAVPSGTAGSGNGSVTIVAASNPETVSRSTTLNIAGESVSITQGPSSVALAPAIYPAGVVNAASFAAGQVLAPGSVAALFGTDLTARFAQASAIPLPSTLENLSVTFNGIPAPLFHLVPQGPYAPAQINVQVPWNVLEQGQTQGTATVVVTRNGTPSPPMPVSIGPFSPGVFAITLSSGKSLAIAINLDGSLAGPVGSMPGYPTHPAKPGDVVQILVTGLGEVDTPVLGNGMASMDTLRRTTTTPAVLFGGVPAAEVQFSGLAPSLVGVNQVNAVVPTNAPKGPAVPLQIQIGGMTTTATIIIAID